MQSLSSTTLTCLLDDPKITESLGEFLLQVQGGISQGSSQTGLKTPKGSVMLTTNSSPETARYSVAGSPKITYNLYIDPFDKRRIRHFSHMTSNEPFGYIVVSICFIVL